MSDVKTAARLWLAEDPDPVTREELRAMIDRGDEASLHERFGARLEFGTAGLRGVLGAGPNRMNRAVVIRTTAGLCEHLREHVPDCAHRGVVVGCDGRRMSREFARDVAATLAGAGIPAHVFSSVVPTPLVAYAVTALNAAAGVMITASHNPPEYNGYKAYWGNGAQIIPPHDTDIAAAIAAIGPLASIATLSEPIARKRGLHHGIPDTLAASYLAGVRALGIHPDAPSNLSMVYTALHGVGARWATEVLPRFGTVHSVPEQSEPDGDFPTVAFPNPEEPGAMDMAMALARSVDADIVLANDPDADRLAVAAKHRGAWVQLTGNDVGALLGHYLLTQGPAGDRMVATTIVSSPVLGEIARAQGVRYAETLTGFKWIANKAMQTERATGTRFVFGFEEALGYTVGTLARDKDGIGAAYVVAELAAGLKALGRTLVDALEDLSRAYGCHLSRQHAVTLRGADGMERIADIMAYLRENPPESLAGRAVTAVRDYHSRTRTETSGDVTLMDLPVADVVVFELGNACRVIARPSGTEPKIKYYMDVAEPITPDETYADGTARAKRTLDALARDFVAYTERAT